MAVVKPLYMSNGKPIPMSTTMVDNIVDECCYLYGEGFDFTFGSAPPVYPKAYNSNSEATTLNDNRMPIIPDTAQVSGGGFVHAHNFANQAQTIAWAGNVTARGDIDWRRVCVREPEQFQTWREDVGQGIDPSANIGNDGLGSRPSASTNTDYASGLYFPLKFDENGDIQAMTFTDLKDTFINTAIDKLVVAGTTGLPATAAGTFIVTNDASAPTNFVNKDAHKIFQDTCADTDSYTTGASGITMGGGGGPAPGNNTYGPRQQHTKDVTGGSYYLHMRTGTQLNIQPALFWDNDSNGFKTKFNEAHFNCFLKRWMADTVIYSTEGYKICYALLPNDSTWPGGTNGNEVNRGIIYNKILGGSTYTKDGVGSGDRYASQMWPSGTLAQDGAAGHGPYTLWLRKQ